MARWVKSKQLMQIFKTATTPTALDGLRVGDLWIDTTTTAVVKVCTAITPAVTFDVIAASGLAGALSGAGGFTTTATAAATTTLTVSSTEIQNFTGVTTQTVKMPVVTTLIPGWRYIVPNNSSGIVTAQSSGANTISAIPADSIMVLWTNSGTATTAASWDYYIIPLSASITGTGDLVRATSPNLTTPTFSGNTLVTGGTLTANNGFRVNNGVLESGAPTGGNSGTTVMYPTTASKGNFQLFAVDNAADYFCQIRNASFGQSTTLTIPDPGAAAAIIPTIVKTNGTEGSNIVTASGHAGVITTSALSTVAGGTYVITWTNTKITTASAIVLTKMGGTNTITPVDMKVVAGSGSAVITLYNDDLLNALNGTLLIGYMLV